MAQRDCIVAFLDRYLRVGAFRDASQNGLQVQGRTTVKHIVFGVSASLELFKRAAGLGADMVITHHGLFWDGPVRLTGGLRARVAQLIKNDLNFAAYHLPLDAHPVCGNNARLLKLLGARAIKPFGSYHDTAIGFRGELKTPKSLASIEKIFEKAFGAECRTAAFGPAKIRTVGVVSGGAGGLAAEAVNSGLDLFITGEPSEPAWEWCREGGASFMALGHYNSEKAGVIALAEALAGKFGVKTEFIDVPNPF
ncbi:MAG: Nif3-like dinuclear metal center hexameric protein [Elusimicrobiaceae bacterium]|nr:Nif3-like dinuclear metal center hexameric protein [Elusimicrobiaceae bacterium]